MVDKKQVLIDFGKRLKKIRLSKKISQEKLALDIDFHRTYISLIERGERNVTLFSIHRIAEILEVDPSEFFIEDDGRWD